MKKSILAIAAASTIAAGTTSAPTTADAGCYGCALGAGVLAKVVAGTIIGGRANADRNHHTTS
jgi:anaerobic selenocysteine-containing dehydrogenase